MVIGAAGGAVAFLDALHSRGPEGRVVSECETCHAYCDGDVGLASVEVGKDRNGNGNGDWSWGWDRAKRRKRTDDADAGSNETAVRHSSE